MAVQLVPLPPAIWTQLPQREIYLEIALLMEMEQHWRPLSLAPTKTLNSLFSMSIPLATCLLFIIQTPESRTRIMPFIAVLGLVSGGIALLQLLGSPNGPLYFYDITNNGAAVGLFSNRNHQAIFLASVIIMLAWHFSVIGAGRHPSTLSLLAITLAVLAIIPLILVTGSRAGILVMLVAIFPCAYFYYAAVRRKNRRSADKISKNRKLIIMGLAVAFLSVIALAFVLARAEALDRLLNTRFFEGIRANLLPVLWQMAKDYFPFGSGFGSFQHIFTRYESLELLRPNYLNQAHNDWLQFLIEGGVAAVFVAIALLIWISAKTIDVFRNTRAYSGQRRLVIANLSILGVMALASAGDYPLRVPIIMMVSTVSLCLLGSLERVERRSVKTG
ncbi:O-antigen ligase family protein [Parasphingorhabdus marina]|nr:O-antigen ligase family protein [Parasphingorhabdus marina]